MAAGGVGPSVHRVPRTAAPCLHPRGYEHAVSLSRPCLGYDGCSVLFQNSMEELGRGSHSPAGKFFPSMLLCHIPKCVLCGGEEADGSPGKVCFPSQALLGSQMHTSWTGSSSLLLFRVSTSCAQSELSYYTATVLPLGATPGRLEGAGRGWRPPHAWPRNRWPQDSPGLSQTSAAMDRPLRIHPVPAPGADSACPCPWHCPPGTASAGTAAMQCMDRDTRSLSCSACMNRLKLQLLPAPSWGWWTSGPHSAHSQCVQSHPMWQPVCLGLRCR